MNAPPSLDKKRALGRGLESLLGKESPQGLKVLLVDIEQVEVNPNQPRQHFKEDQMKALSESIKTHGVLQPLLVQKQGGKYRIIAGERRWRASQRAGIHKIPVIVKTPDARSELVWALIENLQRADLNPMEEARAYAKILQEGDYTQEALAQALSRSRASLSNTIRLLSLDPKVQAWIAEGKISFAQGRELLKEKSRKRQRELAKKCFEGRWTVRDLRSSFESLKEEPPHWVQVSLNRFESLFKRKISLNYKKGRGRLSIKFQSEEELKDLLERLCKK